MKKTNQQKIAIVKLLIEINKEIQKLTKYY